MNKLKIDETLCIGCGACISIAGNVFALDEKTGKAKVISQPEAINENIKTAIKSCPVNAIKTIKEENESKN